MTGPPSPLRPEDPSRTGGYRLLARLGEGGMGVVYLGRTESGALAAVKVVRAEYAEESAFLARFRREVETARRISSPWVVPVTGADPEAEPPWLATEFVAGPSLAEAVGTYGPLPAPAVRTLGRMLCAALGEVHAAGLVHRDVQPANVLLAPDGPRFIDFGIARTSYRHELTSTGLIVGTPGFVSPEQIRADGDRVGPPSDLFSLGCLLAYALTGRPPFGTGPADAVLDRALNDPPDLPADGLDPAGRELTAALLSCLAKDPADRPTAAELGALLAGDTGEVPGSAWLPGPVVRLIAERSDRILALPGIDGTEIDAAGGGDAEAGAVADADTVTGSGTGPAPTAGRRRFLLLASGGALLVAGGAGAAVALLRDSGGDGGDSGDGDGNGGGGPSGAETGPGTVAIGLQADLTGGQRAYGTAQERGARLAVEQFNARPDKPFSLVLRTADDGGSPGRAPAAAKKLIEDPAVLAVLGPTTDATALAVLAAYDRATLPLIAVSPGSLALGLAQSRSFLHARPVNTAVSLPLGVYLATRTKARRPGLLQDRTSEDYGWQSIGISDMVVRAKGRRPYPRVVPAGTEDFGPVVADMLRAGVDSVIFGGYARGAARTARALAAAGFTGPRLAPQAVLDDTFLTEAGAAAEGWVVSASFIDATAVPGAQPFRDAYRVRYAAPPGPFAAESYDVVNLVIQELTATRSRPTRKALTGRLRAASYQGVSKTFSFDPADGGFADNTAVFLHQVENGAFRFLGRAPFDTA
ncbi:bifunctional serine/threonine-protein kinase/ABC transporter substrate-binding protein [Streptomyces paludis]|uniref:Serine/threonine protein kinase n=1 Tax=Streptomyces paludis TaxID=2282738 RepID=A0A345HKV1_9ACTN|nr:bifunctional serine/threonine-protein kinase/ABC transporter substrate-binding protein [Streptomyces paludis]AXG77325.1 serine/threonine protein kinase [Streptomyces paludis]